MEAQTVMMAAVTLAAGGFGEIGHSVGTRR